MLHWIALLPGSLTPCLEHDEHEAPPSALSALHLGWRMLQFTPRVALLEDAVVLEVQASERLFGGAVALRQRVVSEALAHGVQAWAHAGSALAALALARSANQLNQGSQVEGHDQRVWGDSDEDDDAQAHLADRLNALPLDVLPGVAAHAQTLARLGCRSLADVRALPRGGLSRRFGAALLQTLDQAYGERPEAFEWLTLPPVFEARLELPGRVETAPGLLFAANRLLKPMCAWLAGRQAAALAFTLRWRHDWHRRDSSSEGEWTVRLGSPSRDETRLSRLLAEHLQRIQLSAPVGEISLHTDAIEALPLSSQQLFQEHREDQLSARPDALLTPAAQRAQRDALLALLDKLSVRLGEDHVLQARILADHRLEHTQHWLPAIQALSKQSGTPAGKAKLVLLSDMPQPGWVLAEPLLLATNSQRGGQPIYQGRLDLLAGPHRIEAGWWDASTGHTRVTRDYYLASSAHAGLLWIFKVQQQPDDTRSPWYLHGFFA